ncbi:hypothetical protein [Nannocystis pusilla]|uniref:hypothetical protein n=1 Tax=Nannocystis pusilla TaxID=889268 RepID=UPI003DA4CC22
MRVPDHGLSYSMRTTPEPTACSSFDTSRESTRVPVVIVAVTLLGRTLAALFCVSSTAASICSTSRLTRALSSASATGCSSAEANTTAARSSGSGSVSGSVNLSSSSFHTLLACTNSSGASHSSRMYLSARCTVTPATPALVDSVSLVAPSAFSRK